VKTRIISGHQHVVRVDEEQEDDLNASDEQRLLDQVAELLRAERPEVVVLEDYNKGVLTEAVITGIIALAKAAGVPVAVDPKRKNFFTFRGVDLFKPNLKELREGLKIDLNAADGTAMTAAISELQTRLGNRISMITLSEHGVLGPARHAQRAFPRPQTQDRGRERRGRHRDRRGRAGLGARPSGADHRRNWPTSPVGWYAKRWVWCPSTRTIPHRMCAPQPPGMTVTPYSPEGSKREQVEQMFDAISPSTTCSTGSSPWASTRAGAVR
jgi:hypothetical protein